MEDIEKTNIQGTFELETKSLETLLQLLKEKRRIVLLPHTAPDGDAFGSTLGLMLALRGLNREADVQIVSPDPAEPYLSWMPSIGEVVAYRGQEERAIELVEGADLLLHVDHNQVSRLRYEPLMQAVRSSRADRVLIDHHLYPEEGMKLYFSYPGVSSTCELALAILLGMGAEEHITKEAATCLLTGIITDTGRFLYGCFAPSLFVHFSKLLELGADYQGVIHRLNYCDPEARLRLQGYVLGEKLVVVPELRTAYFTLSKEEFARFGVSKGDTEGLVNLPLSVEGIDSCCFIREDQDQIKLSLRSKGDLPINIVAMRGFSGGGHLNAAGGEFEGGDLEAAKNAYLYELKRLMDERAGASEGEVERQN